MIELKNIRKVYKANSRKEAIALDDINLKFSNRGLVFVLGPSGSGKTTLLNLIGGLDSPSSGDILIDGEKRIENDKSLEDFRSKYVSIVFQESNLIQSMNVKANLSLVCFDKNSSKVNERINEALSIVGLSNYLNRYPFELSGGEEERVAIARALLKDSSFILADEPTGNLDSKSSDEIVALLKKSNKELKQTIIMITHNLEIAKMADRIIKIEDGKIVEEV